QTADDGPIVLPKKAGASSSVKMKEARGPSPAELGLIPIQGSASTVAKPTGKTDPYAFYQSYYHSNDRDRSDPEKLRKTVRDLNSLGKTREVHAALVGYLKNHSRLAETWMYEALALSIEINGGTAADVKTALNYAADLAERARNPNLLVSAADK